MTFRKVFYLLCLLTLGVMGFNGMGINVCGAACTWDCSCGQKGLITKYCGECGAKRPGIKNASEVKAPTRVPPVKSEIHMYDGPGMANVNYWKHNVLDGGWITPKGDIALEISGFDFKIGIYKQGEPDNFRWHENRFYFAGWQNSPDRNARFDLLLSCDPKILDANGNVLVSLEEMWHEQKSIYMKLKYPDTEGFVIRELRKPQDIVE